MRIIYLATLGAALSASHIAVAQTWPTRPVRMIVPFAAGGGTDIQARLFGAKLSPALGQSVVVENRPGGGGNIGAELVAKAPPDGHVVLLQSASIAVNQTLYSKLNYNAVRDLAPVMLVSSTPLILVVHPTVPARNVKELIAIGRAKPDVFNFGSNSTGSTSHLAAELLKTMTGMRMPHIPYKGSGQGTIALLGGEIDMIFTTLPPAVQHVRSSKMRALAVTTLKRAAIMPEVPTMSETLKGFEMDNWYGMFFPAKTPGDIITRMHSEMMKVLKDRDVRALMEKDGSEPLGSTPEEFGAYLKREIDKFAKVIQASGAHAD